MTGRFACGGKRDMVYVEVGTRLIVLGKDLLTNLTGLIRRTFREEDNHLAEFLIRALRNNKRYAHVRTELTLEFLSLDFQTTRADDIVFATKNTETMVGGKRGNIVGDEAVRTNLWGLDDQAIFGRKTDADRRKWSVPK
jgi:hypothetical protein